MASILKYDKDVTLNITANLAVTRGLLYGINSSGNFVLADQTTGPQVAFGFAPFDNLSTDVGYLTKAVALTTRGVIDFADTTSMIAGGTFTVGATVWLGTAGGYTTTKPTTNGHLAQAVGIAVGTTRAVIEVSMVPLLAQTAGNSNIGI
jgi:hypothetical protein